MKKLFLKISQYSQENACVRVSFQSSCGPSDLQLFKKEILPQVFFCKYCEIFKKAYFGENLRLLLNNVKRNYSFMKTAK